MKKILSILVVVMMILLSATAAFAADGEHDHEFICTAVNETQHTFTCQCGETYTEDHAFSDWIDNQNSGLFTPGTHSAVCGGCGFEKTERMWGSSTFFHPFFELYYLLKDFIVSSVDKLLGIN